MLIIAMPKSASTALHETLVAVTNAKMAEYPEVDITNKPTVKQFSAIARMHGDCRKLPTSLLKQWAESNDVYKLHILPTKQHQRALQKEKVVILLRNSQDAILSYFRTYKNLGARYPKFSDCDSQQEWLQQAEANGLSADMNKFYESWLNYSGDHLLIRYADLVKNPQKVVKKVARYWNLDVSTNNIELKKSRYTRIPDWQKYFIRIRRTIGQLVYQNNL